MSETKLMHAIRAALAAQPDVTLWRCNGGVDLAKGVRYGLGLGAADLIGILAPHGVFLAFEVKTPKGRQSTDQRLWGAAVTRAGGFYAVVRSPEEAIDQLARAREYLEALVLHGATPEPASET